MKRHAYKALVLTLTAMTLALACVSPGIGYAPLDLAGTLPEMLRGEETLASLVLVEIRIPRVLLGLVVGFSLGLAGAAMQGLLRNPLAEPGVIGISGAASFGAVVVFYSGLAGTAALALPLGGIAGALIATSILCVLAARGAGTAVLILAGIAINSFTGALTALALNLSPNPYAAFEIVFWMMGSLADRSFDHVWLALPFMLCGWLLMLASASALDGLTLGENVAQSLGFNLNVVRTQLVLGAALAVGSAVAVSGVIGFVGLVVPHLLRPLVEHRPGRLLLVSGLGGALLVLLADSATRLLPIRPELKLGVLTAVIGAPFLFQLVWRLRREV
ncbi:FecCD family ABC transporter permease [Marinivivus vitaminiproducens]|uniref:FecCD family ABC transporter permease n=1 Tax=Marinivivus vitaminiproducens TaxID=3035935 RepID=UPI00279A167E|nr:iron ABC transporter permease [Geminicoccaceae bacterium SCSIO 64248]